MLSKNFQAEYLNKISEEIRARAIEFKELYAGCYEKIEVLKKEAVTAQATNKIAGAAKNVGEFIGKIPVVKEGLVDEFLIGVGATINEAEQKQLEKTMAFFIQYKESGIAPIVDHIDMVNQLSNRPTVMIYDKKVLSFQALQEAV